MDRVLKRLIREAMEAERRATDWKALEMIKRNPAITKNPELQAWYNQMGAERRVASRVFEILDIYRLSEEEAKCLLYSLKYHSNWSNLHPIKFKKDS